MNVFLEFARTLFRQWTELPLGDRSIVAMLVLGSPAVWLFQTVTCWRLLRKHAGADASTVGLAPISARGTLVEELGHGGVAMALRAEMFTIHDALQRVLGDRPAPYIAPALGRDTGYYLVGLRQEAPIPLDVREPDVQKIEQSIVLKVGGVTVPITEIIDLLITVVGAFPVPFRARYERSLVEVDLVNSGDQTRLTVCRRGTPAKIARRRRRTAGARAGTRTVLFTQTVTTRTLEDLLGVVRDAAFMILEIQGSFAGRRWRGMRCLLDGLVCLDEYRRTATADARDRARLHMRGAVEADPDNLEALYFHGSMTMVDQTDGAIDEAIRCLDRTLDAPPGKLRALVHTGLAYCYAQQWHRLGQRRRDVLARAEEHAACAEREWRALRIGRRADGQVVLHPLIPYTRALVTTMDEGSDDDQGERVRRFTAAHGLYQQAMALQPDNGMFCNNAGWVLMKLAEWGIADLPGAEESGSEISQTALLAEKYLQRSMGLNPRNKLTHANLCLLYSLPPFRDDPAGMYLGWSRYYGLKAVTIDPGYVNGHRDLAVALVRYGDLDGAYIHFSKALELADLLEKDRELMTDLVREVEKQPRLGVNEITRWRNPAPALLEPVPPAATAR